MQEKLQRELPYEIKWLALEEPDTAGKAIDMQAERVFRQLQEHNVDTTTPLLLVGYSQGGLKAYWLSQKYRQKLNIKGIVAIGTPWEGTPLLTDESRRSLQVMLSFSALGVQEPLKRQLTRWLSPGRKGVDDLKPGSNFLKTVQKSLKNDSIPIFAIAGKTPALNKLAPFAPLVQNFLGETDNDLLVPVDSQLANNINVNTETFRRGEPVTGVFHIPIDPSGEFSLHHSQVIQQVKTFITEKSKLA
eukprot:CAMPEP_0116863928 /NCGR_PEP_ID=MMETSP0418-20121206/24520_1 /TAXON_ID=1158023 /ORGANISM="Astrosyne radiata, Strain 13vi08-1A" /LENGTH=245 /DNA_ID=CAMNT_0004499055 /DNA_START=2165 /DNA_END=2902 /DNA_ORIENTATION=-